MNIALVASAKPAAQQALSELVQRCGQSDLADADYIVAIDGDVSRSGRCTPCCRLHESPSSPCALRVRRDCSQTASSWLAFLIESKADAGQSRCGAPASRTSRCGAAFCTWSRSWTGRAASSGVAAVQHHGHGVLHRGPALEEALGHYGRPEIFNTDQGSQFTSPRFTRMLKEANVRISMDGKGRWMENVFIERLWRSLKYECVYLQAFETGTEARKGSGTGSSFIVRSARIRCSPG